ncbi:hypothetical protein HYV83_00780 [Candidatus Woesearchaeota archaeon]|nr:hypothetical protein [Candidatus Woesearchaeota archaeon]
MALGEAEIREKLEQGYLRISTVIEIVGAPKEHVEGTLRLVLKQLREETGTIVLGGKVHEPKAQGPFFSTFAELQVLVKNFAALVNICFNYMPSSVEIVEPTQFKLAPLEFSNLFNDLLGRLHEVDMRLKNTNAANALLDKNLYNLLKNVVLLLLEPGSKNLGELSSRVGIAEQQLEPFLAKFAEEKLIKKDGHHYTSLVKR